jgi:hypothetical protein
VRKSCMNIKDQHEEISIGCAMGKSLMHDDVANSDYGNAIAVIGFAVKLPHVATDTEGFWNLLTSVLRPVLRCLRTAETRRGPIPTITQPPR